MSKSRETNLAPYTIGAVVTLLAGVVLYVYAVNVSVVEVVVKKDLLRERNELFTQISTLETSYIEAQHQIAFRIGELDGYEEGSAKLFVARADTNLAYNGN